MASATAGNKKENETKSPKKPSAKVSEGSSRMVIAKAGNKKANETKRPKKPSVKVSAGTSRMASAKAGNKKENETKRPKKTITKVSEGASRMLNAKAARVKLRINTSLKGMWESMIPTSKRGKTHYEYGFTRSYKQNKINENDFHQNKKNYLSHIGVKTFLQNYWK